MAKDSWPLWLATGVVAVIALMAHGGQTGALAQDAYLVTAAPEPGTYRVLDVGIEVLAHVATDTGGAVRHDVMVSMRNNAGVDSVGLSLVVNGSAYTQNCDGVNAWVRISERTTAWTCFMLQRGEEPDTVIIYDGFGLGLSMSNRVDGQYHIRQVDLLDRPPVPGLDCSHGDGWTLCARPA